MSEEENKTLEIEDEQDEQKEQVNPLDLSDDEYLALSPEEVDAIIADTVETTDANDSETNDEEDDDDDDTRQLDEQEVGDDSGRGTEETSDEDSDGTSDGDSGGDPAEDGTEDSSTETKSEGSETRAEGAPGQKSDLDSASSESDSTQIDYKAQVEQLLSPFRANNKDMKVESVDDARTLMQMGANYNKKMAGLKPNLKLIKMLENNDLLDEEKLAFYIDLDKKDPEAIKKFIKDSGVDLDEIDVESGKDYKANTYTVNDKEVQLDGILDDIQDTESFSKTIDIVSNKWDASSKQILLDQPHLIKVINDHVAAGTFDSITKVVERERMMGRLEGLSDLDAYKAVGDAMEANNDSKSNDSKQVTPKPKAPETKKTVDPKLNSKRKAASSTKTVTGSKGTDNNYNPLSMSDEEFAKMSANKFL